MALQVLLAHTGQRLQVDPSSFISLDAFKIWVANHSTVSAKDHIALTASGKQVRFPGLHVEAEVFVYDGRLLQPSSSGTSKSRQPDFIPLPNYSISNPPDTIANQNDLQAWRDLFMARRSWALKVVDDCQSMAEQASTRYSELETITRGVEAAVLNLDRHVKQVAQKNEHIRAWATDVQKQDEASGDWEGSLKRLKSIPVNSEMAKFITGLSKDNPTLDDFIETEDFRKAGKIISKAYAQLSRNVTELSGKMDDVATKSELLYKKAENMSSSLASRKAKEAAQLMQDIEPIATKVSNDYESVLGYSNTPKSISQASRSALLHTRNFLPSLSKRSREMYDILQSITEMRNKVASEGLDIMQDLSTVTTMVGEMHTLFTAMDLGAEAEEAISLLAMLNKLPVTYAAFVAEAIRRREWNEKVKSDSSTLTNEMTNFLDEEGKRRRRWQKHVGSVLWGEKSEADVIGLEINLLGEEEEWPQSSRQQLEDLIETLRKQDHNSSLVTEVAKILSELSNPTKQQSKRAKAFKAGSIHEAALGRSTLLVRGDDELVRVVQEEKQKVESKLRTAESRVRRLEDLLHRQSQLSRTSTGFQPGHPSPDLQHTANPLVSPRLNEDSSRRSSVSSRRFSANQGADEKALQQKLLLMEAELNFERERASGLQSEISAHKTKASALHDQVEEAKLTKKDLMENLDAQQRDFIEERKSLEGDIKRLKAKLEDMDDEMDRYLGSRENERTTVDERVRTLQDDIERYRKETAAETQKAQGQVDYLRNDAKLQRETNEALEKQLQKAKSDNRELTIRAERAEALVDNQLKALHDVHAQLSPHTVIPSDLSALADLLVTISGDLTAELNSVKSDATIARSDRDSAEAAIVSIKADVERTREKLAKEETATSQLRETLGGERAKFAALEAELADERGQLTSLRTKIADGETGSEALRSRLEDEEKKVTTLSEDLAARISRIGALEEELRTFQDKYQSAQVKYGELVTRFDGRTSRAKDLTQRVYAQNDRLCRLLERLSYSVTREGSSMIIQRLPKPDRSNANDSSDPGTALRRSISGAISRKAMVDSGDLDLLYWMHNEAEDAESEKYDAYLNAIGTFDIETFCEVITKRIKDMEYTAKKWSKDARLYRDKSHIGQKEAHEKIAYKNFKEGDLALFLPTRNQATGAWAAFNVGAPHYFLREQDSHKLRTRDWLLARIHKIEDRVVDLSKSMSGNHPQVSDIRSFGETSVGGDSFEDDNPFDLSDGLRWYLIDAAEEKPGAPSTPGLGKSTVASAHIDATGSIRRSKKSSSSGMEGINKTLSKSLDSRRSSSNSKKAIPINTAASPLMKTASSVLTDTASLKGVPTSAITSESSDNTHLTNTRNQDTNNSDSRDKTTILNLAAAENIANQPTSTGTSPGKKSVIWDSLWSLDLSLESGKNRK